ncbi:MAG: DUF4864 domain-containing protein [Gammaproteobacteria bacterium]|nr:DUF4864 domain-containing protein [Gammaproteobacteria bacterium]
MLGNIADVAQNQLAALRAGDVEKAYAYTSVDFRKDTSLDDYKKFYEGHPIFKNNVSASFLDREFNNDEGKLKGTLKSQDGSLTPIQFILKKENGEWKIEGITLNPDSDTDHSSDVSSVKVNDGTNLLTSKALKFSINYPSDWVYQQTNPHTVEFSEKKDPSSNMLVNLQVLGSKKIGGIYTTTKDVIDDLKKQISDKGKEVKFIGEGAAKLPQSPEKVRGEYFVVTYTYDGVVLKKMQYVLMNESGDAFYTWGYTADTDHFEDSLSAAKAMYESLVMQ